MERICILETMRYTYQHFQSQYPDNEACLEKVFQNRYGEQKFCPKCAAETKFYRVKKRQSYACKWCGYQVFPLAHTIFRSSTTSLKDWFYAIYLFSVAKNGVSAKELERHLGVTYKTAWRMARQIRLLMQDENDYLGGPGKTVEIDGTYVGPKSNVANSRKSKSPVLAMVERGGKLKASVAYEDATTILPFIKDNVDRGTMINSDAFRGYHRVSLNFDHEYVNHARREFSRKGIGINTIEGFFGQLKRSVNGTYHGVSSKYVQFYLNEFVYRYNHREEAICSLLLEAVGRP